MAKKRKIVRELPPVGTVLHGKFKGKPYQAKIVKDKNSNGGKAIEYNSKLYPSMSAAAKTITNQSVNGWRFWKYEENNK